MSCSSKLTLVKANDLLGGTVSSLNADGYSVLVSVELEVEPLEAVVLDELDLLGAVSTLEAGHIANGLPHAHSRCDGHLDARNYLGGRIRAANLNTRHVGGTIAHKLVSHGRGIVTDDREGLQSGQAIRRLS